MEVKQRTARSLLHRLNSSDSLSSALTEIRLLTKQDPDIRHILAESGVLPILTHLLLFNSKDEEEDELEQIQENASAILLNLSISSSESLMSTPSLLPSIATALRSPNPLIHQHAAATLFSLLTVDAYRPIIGSKPDIISSLISLLKSPPTSSSSTRTIKDSLKALFALALYPLNRSSLLHLGAAPALFSILFNHRSRSIGILEDATAVIAQIAGCFECVDEFRKVGGVKILAGMLDERRNGVSQRVRENAASALLNLAMSGGERAVGDIKEVELIEGSVREMVERGSERARRKAEGLLRVLDTASRGSTFSLLHHFQYQEGFTDSATISTLSSSSSSSSSVGSTSY